MSSDASEQVTDNCGYIYVIKNLVGGLGGYKLGKTSCTKRRFKQLEVGTKSELIGTWYLNDYDSVELMFHKKLKSLRIPQSEWFALAEDQLQTVISKLDDLAKEAPPVPVKKYPGQDRRAPRFVSPHFLRLNKL